ncbi:hypothetical protein WA158_002844 [Blastocystis sp. Blastoise]
MAHHFVLTFPETYSYELRNTFPQLASKVPNRQDMDWGFNCDLNVFNYEGGKQGLVYSIQPASKQIVTKPGSRKFPIFLEDLQLLEVEGAIIESGSNNNIDKNENAQKNNQKGGEIEMQDFDDSEFPFLLDIIPNLEKKSSVSSSSSSSSSSLPNTSFTHHHVVDSSSSLMTPIQSDVYILPLYMKVKEYIQTILDFYQIKPRLFEVHEKQCTVEFEIDGIIGEQLLLSFDRVMLGKWFGDIYMTNVDLHLSYTDKDMEFSESVSQRTVLMHEMYNSITEGSLFSFDYLMLILSAGILAGIGLAASNVVVIVASMLVSPLMGPILGSTWALLVHDWDLLKTSLLSELYGLGLCLLCGIFIGICCSPMALVIHPIDDIYSIWPGFPTPEMASRGDPYNLILGFAIAIPSGIGCVLGISGRNTSSLVGVAISASLLPPAVNCGLLWSYAALGLIFGFKDGYSYEDMLWKGLISLLLTIVNIIVILVVGMLVFKLKEVVVVDSASATKRWSDEINRIRNTMDTQKKNIHRTYATVHGHNNLYNTAVDYKTTVSGQHVHTLKQSFAQTLHKRISLHIII